MARKRNSQTQATHSKRIQQNNAAGIDIGATSIYVAVPLDRDPQPVRCYQTFTEDLHSIAGWLRECGIETVAMESTGGFCCEVQLPRQLGRTTPATGTKGGPPGRRVWK